MWKTKPVLGTKQGFTLIEIIVVLIIVGVLSSISISSLFSWIEKSKVAEILPVLKDLADSVDLCVVKSGLSQASVDTCMNAYPILSTTQNFTIYGFRKGYPLGYMIVYGTKATNNASSIGDVSCDDLMTLPTSAFGPPFADGIIAICGYPDDGTNTSANKSKHIFVGLGIFSGLF